MPALKRRAYLWVAIICCLLSFSAGAKTLVLGQLSDRPKKDFKQLRPMVEYVTAKLADVGVTDGSVKLFRDLPSMIAAVREGEVDWITETPFAASVLVEEAGAKLLAHKWKDGQRTYQTLIYTHQNSPIRQLQDLRGHLFAFEHDSSFSSYFVPRIVLEREGLSLLQHKVLSDPAPVNQLGYVFSRNERNNLLWVHKGLVAAGALNDSDWRNPDRVPPSLKSQFRILYRSELYPRALELVSGKLQPEIAEALKQVLLSMSLENDRDIMERYEGTTQFEAVSTEVEQLLRDVYQQSQSWSQ